MRITTIAAILMLAAPVAWARPEIVTYSKGDLARIAGQVCGPAANQGAKGYIARRTSNGSIVYVLAVGRGEAVLVPDTSQCNKVSSDTADLWRADDGNAVAQLYIREGDDLLLIGDAEMKGKRFDVDRSGQYVLISQGRNSSVSALAKPYRSLVTLNIDAQRLFVRKRDLLVVGDNPATGQLEASVIRVGQDGLVVDKTIPIPNMRAGVRVLDYAESSDDLLLGGVDASGQTLFVCFNVGSGESSGVAPQKPGDDGAMFIADRGIRNQFTGGAAPASSGGKKKGFFSR
ncbi:MAG: hypothetical protein K1X53_09080 [Candidatus Sumerlaeaceae bacterium]|nr:hypothetical protein [Candidatus Sumerlaeaceae bacterium]